MHFTAKLIAVLLVAFLSVRMPASEGLQDELVHRQRDSGLTLSGFAWGVKNVDFAKRSSWTEKSSPLFDGTQNGVISPDGKKVAIVLQTRDFSLGIVDRDGTRLVEYRNISHAENLCWSKDGERIVVGSLDLASSSHPPTHRLGILDLSSRKYMVIGDSRAYTSSQCWSPDGLQIVYAIGETVGIYDLRQKKWNEIVHGEIPSWSPDGQWIGFLDHDSFYLAHPDGEGRKFLFKQRKWMSGLLWSPDSTMVAYVVRRPHLQLVPDCTMSELRVRRLADNADEQVDHFCGLATDHWSWAEIKANNPR